MTDRQFTIVAASAWILVGALATTIVFKKAFDDMDEANKLLREQLHRSMMEPSNAE